jgi:Rps23 Pro-64 3,4-dihydroxylase Tpa1-like proline 4-hydroxylase
MQLRLNAALDAPAVAAAYARSKRLHVPHFLETADAEALHAEIAAQRQWNFVIFAHEKNMDLDAAGWDRLDAETKRKAIAIVHERANHEFAFMHYKLSLYDRYHQGRQLSPGLIDFFEFLNGEAFLGFARAVTGHADIAFADAQLTAFSPGHFVTIHNDDLEGKNRRAAYVLNLTPEWREDWGGYLNFFDDDGHVVAGFKPAFNALNLFSVPMRHAVGAVAPFARKPRIVVSGWLRAGADPMRAAV